jgi:hypothetical protein
MAFTQERILEISYRYGLLKVNDEGAMESSIEDPSSIKLFHAPKNSVSSEELTKSYLTDKDIEFWATPLNSIGVWEVLFLEDPELKDTNNKYISVGE